MLIKGKFGIEVTDDLGKYLGVPLLHGRVTKSIFQPVVEQVKKRLVGWQKKMLSFAGRATLVQSVLTAIPLYTM